MTEKIDESVKTILLPPSNLEWQPNCEIFCSPPTPTLETDDSIDFVPSKLHFNQRELVVDGSCHVVLRIDSFIPTLDVNMAFVI